MKANINLIQVKDRFRTEYGDIEGLANSINELGLLHPPIVDSNYKLIDGERRIRALRHLGFSEIEIRIVHVPSLIKAEFAANEFAKQWTVSERVAIAKAIEDELGNRQGKRTDLVIDSKKFKVCPKCEKENDFETDICQYCFYELVQNFAQVESGKKSIEIAADKAGFNNKETYRQAKKVIEESIPEIIEMVDSGELSINSAYIASALPEEEQKEIIEEINQGVKPSEAVKNHNHRAQGTGENEWYTPGQYLNTARDFMGGFDIDPASSELANKTVKANKFFDIEANGLNQKWLGKIWMNPPYSQPDIRLFIEKLVDEFNNGNVTEAIALTHNYTDTAWFHTAINTASAVCFTRGRIGFINPEGKKAAPTQGQAFIYFGDRAQEFNRAFSQFGKVLFCE